MDENDIIVDEEYIANNFEDELEFYAELAGLYLSETEERITLMNEALAAKNSESLNKIGHSLKGASGYIGSPKMQGISSRIEKAGKDGDFQSASLALNDIAVCFEELKENLKNKNYITG